jgi:hypothetical protein
MDHELAFLLVIGVLWVLIGGTVSRHIVRVFQKDISPKRTYVTQLLLLVSLPLWSLAMVPGFHAMDLFPERRIYLSVFIGGLIYWFLILYWCLRLSFFATAVLWLVNCLVTVGLLTASMPNITVAGVRALATKANGEMRSTGTALKDYKMATGALPLPVNEVSQPVEGHRIAIGGVDQSTKEVAIYYRGPSFVPDGLFEKVYDGPGPTDPFRRTDLAVR